jgi:hypothetical protein
MGQTKQTRHVCPLCSTPWARTSLRPRIPISERFVLETQAKLHQQITCKRPDLSTFLRAAPEPPAHEGTAKQGKMPAPPGQAPGCPFYPCDVPGCLFCALVCIYLAKEELCCTLCFVGTRSKVRACVRRTVRVASSLPANLIPGLMIGLSALKSVSAVRN